MQRLPGKYIVLAMLIAFLLVAVFVVLVALVGLGSWGVMAGGGVEPATP